MPRRRSRIVLVAAVVIVFLLYRVVQNSEWDPASYAGLSHKYPTEFEGHREQHESSQEPKQKPIPKPPPPPKHEPVKEAPTRPPPTVKLPDLKSNVDHPGHFGIPTQSTRAPTADKSPHAAPSVTKSTITRPLLGETSQATATPTSSQVHWEKFGEHYPVDEESIILLPTGKPKPIPKVQYQFGPESEPAKDIRLKRQREIKAEMHRAWSGYRKYAWMHDELSPVSQSNRDPFCGWAATLVDSLDTLWIMGMKDEFDEAAKAATNIDFTTTTRETIPVFETIIRYLGGLLAAFDVSGGHEGNYKMLLHKAQELAEILMGVFDTPNRMPILYYNWKPEAVVEPHQATWGSVAELGSMTMEFTRLAQLTGKLKYYDAAARITNAFEEWQNRGTTLDGIFPEQVDTSGCNRTAAMEKAKQSNPQGEQNSAAPSSETPWWSTQPVAEPPLDRQTDNTSPYTFQSTGEPYRPDQRSGSEVVSTPKREIADGEPTSNTSASLHRREYGVNGYFPDSDCVPQGLVPGGYGHESYSMGGSQDSTYEYFPKQYLLLGGLEPKYKTMHIKVIEAVKKWLLYRPMTPDERDILFSAKVSTNGFPSIDIQKEYEVTHLTCFIGGMFGLGGKIFNRPDDVELAKKLADGCVWAYESMPSGIMPEGATVVHCQSMSSCPWNETVWWEHLDPQGDWRARQLEEYMSKKEAEKSHEDQVKLKAELDEKQRKLDEEKGTETSSGFPSPVPDADPPNIPDAAYPRPEPGRKHVERRAALPEGPIGSAEDMAPHRSSPDRASDLNNQLDLNYEGNVAASKTENINNAAPFGGTLSQIPMPEDPNKPLTHEEYVRQRITSEKIPPGFVNISWRKYILRPEAIESVWYMYRITGDPIWMEKGWRMWKAIIKAVRTDFGHSAVEDILEVPPRQVDEMESFWIAETLKYFYLLFSTPDTISLDEWVLNTEAHPFRRPT